MKHLRLRVADRVSRWINPIIIKEMRAQMRGSRAFWVLTGYLLLLGLLAYGLYRITLSTLSTYYGPGSLPQSALIGQALFVGLAFLEMLFICFITPALTAGTISGEVERRTSDMLLVTPLRPASIVWGKMFASLTYVLLLILAAIPLASIVFLFGGVALRDMIQVIGLLALTAITYGTIGVFFSALTRRTGRAVVLSYVVVLTLVFGSLFVWTFAAAMNPSSPPPNQIVYVSPISALVSAIVTPEMSWDYYRHGPVVGLFISMGGGGTILGTAVPGVLSRPVWQYTSAIYLTLTVILCLLTARLVRPVRRWRIGWLGAVALALLLILLAAGGFLVFGSTWGSTGFSGPPTPVPVPFSQTGVVIKEAPLDVVAVPLPEPTPLPAPVATFEAAQHEAAMTRYLEQALFPGDGTTFCDLLILGDDFQVGNTYANVYAWAYCRMFKVEDGELVPGLGFSAPVMMGLYWPAEQDWQVGGYWSGPMRDMLPLEVQNRLLAEPYDEAAGDERLLERARQALLGEE